MGNAFKAEYQNVLGGEAGRRAPKYLLYRADGIRGLRVEGRGGPGDRLFECSTEGRPRRAELQNPRSERDAQQHHLRGTEISCLLAPDFSSLHRAT